MTAEPNCELLRARSASFALLALVLGPDPSPLGDPGTIDVLRVALDAAGDTAARARLDLCGPVGDAPAEALAGRWIRWFDLGRVAPYEGSNVASSAGGVTPRLADIAGFYRAFGLTVTNDRPDHVVAQLEFLSYALLREAEAHERGAAADAATTVSALRMFVRDHVGTWIDAWALRVGNIAELAPWAPFAAAAADLVRAEAARLHVIPLQEAPILCADTGIPDDEERVLLCD